MPNKYNKQCTHCKKFFSTDNFCVDKSSGDGMTYWCKKCLKNSRSKYQKKLSIRQHIVIPETKKCARCGEIKSYECFSYSRHQVDGLVFQCKQCKKEIELLKNYKISQEDWDKKFINQGEKCPICGNKNPAGKIAWATDHNHKTSQVRSILCTSCNKLIGHAFESPSILRSAADYLEKWEKEE